MNGIVDFLRLFSGAFPSRASISFFNEFIFLSPGKRFLLGRMFPSFDKYVSFSQGSISFLRVSVSYSAGVDLLDENVSFSRGSYSFFRVSVSYSAGNVSLSGKHFLFFNEYVSFSQGSISFLRVIISYSKGNVSFPGERFLL